VSHSVGIVGAGHNGLTAAILLARAGWKVRVFEARPQVGGLAAALPFGEGFAAPGLLHDTSGVRDHVLAALALVGAAGLERRFPRILAPSTSGELVWLEGRGVGGALSEAERRRWEELRGFVDRVAPVLAELLDRAPFEPTQERWAAFWTGLKVRRMGKADMMELARVSPAPIADWLGDRLSSERLRAALALPTLIGEFVGPRSAGTSLSWLLRQAVSGPELVGGPATLVRALEGAARASGVELHTGARVAKIDVVRRRVRGLELEGGSAVPCEVVLATCDPRTALLGLVGPHRLPERLARDAGRIRSRGTTAKMHLALRGPLTLADGTDVEALRTGESLDELERSFDPVKYRSFAPRPVLDLRVFRGAGVAPAGHSVVSALVLCAARDPRGGWSSEARAALSDAVLTEVGRHCPEVRGQIVAQQLLTPADLEREFGLAGGNLHHGEQAIDQLFFMRPTVDTSRFATPIAGLYLGGAGSHPGGGLTCMPGSLAAQRILADSR
jgi:phytoene dehydrogenase-like protein